MKKIELTAPLRFVLVILIWLLTFTVVNLTGTLNNGGAGLIGTLVLYVGALYLSFSYFNDCQLKKACKVSLLVMVIIVMFYLFVQCFGQFINLCELGNNEIMNKIYVKLNDIFLIGKNVALIVFLILAIVQTICACDDKKCCCKKEETKEVEAKEEAKEEAPAEEEKAEEKEAE